MLTEEIFYSTFWISMFSVVWFYTDWFLHYTSLLGVALNTRLSYLSYITENPNKFFPDFLYEKALNTNNQTIKFLGALISCPLCLHVWLSALTFIFYFKICIIAPVYILSLFIVFQIKKLI